MPEVWSIDDNGTISRRRELSLTHEDQHGSSGSAAATDSPRADHGVWGSSSFVGRNEQLIACAKDGEIVP